jgi:pimeloyl-ACP methyl ester carboxylesterase
MSQWKMWVRRFISIIILVIAIVGALIAAGLAPYALAAWTAHIRLLAAGSVVTFGLIVLLGAWGSAAVWRTTNTRRAALWIGAVLTGVFALALFVLVLKPFRSTVPGARPSADTRYWQLSTGSRIAYVECDPPAGVSIKPYPIIYLHGGPGMSQAPFDKEAYGSFSQDGFRVFLYDQAGSGQSDILPHLVDYTIPRAVEDLEAIRQTIGTDKLILIGHSWGSTLAASYMAKYPQHVDKVVFHAPGPLWSWDKEVPDYSRTDSSGKGGFPSPRLIAAALLLNRNRNAAESLLPQREAQQIMVPMISPTVGTLVCKGDSAKEPSVIKTFATQQVDPHFNPYVLFALSGETTKSTGDPHQTLRGNETAAILLYPECNYLSWSGAVDYRKTFGDLKIYYIPGAGHFIQFEQPDLLHAVIRSFLLDQPGPLPPYTSDTDPRTAAHP